MTVFNSFFLLFKNDAAKSKKDVADLEKQIDSLRAKGKARSEEENKQLKDATARHKEIQKNMKETQQATEKLGESLVTAAAAYVSFSAIKAGIVNTAEFNRNLTVQSRNLQQTTKDMRAYSAATEKAGGTQEELLGFVESKTRQAASSGLGPFDMKKYFQGLRNYMRGMDNAAKLAVLSDQGITGPGLTSLALASDADFDKRIKEMYELAQATGAADRAATEFGESSDALGQSLKTYWSTVGESVLPVITEGNNALTEFFHTISENKDVANSVFAGMLATLTAISTMLPRIIYGIGAMGGAAAAAGLTATGVTAVGASAYAIPRLSLEGGRAIGRGLNRYLGRGDENGYLPGQEGYSGGKKAGDTGGDAMSFWMSQGYTRAQAAGIVANEHHESGGDPMARGDGGKAHGLYQWHPDRRARIKAATGIDVSNASAADQRRAAAWEMKYEPIFDDDVFRQLQSPDQAAAYFSSKFERPADAFGQAMARGRTALGIANDNMLGAIGGGTSSNSSIKIDKIEVNTQATDANGIANDIGGALEDELAPAYGNFDDGVAG